MKVAIRCANCNQIKRRNEAYRVKLFKEIVKIPTAPLYVVTPSYELIFICKKCAAKAGYKITKNKNA